MTTSFSTQPILHQDSGPHKFGMGSHGTNMDLSIIDNTLYMPLSHDKKVKKLNTIVG